MSVIIRPAEVPDYKIIVEYDQFLGERRIDMERGELFVADVGEARAVGYFKLTSNEFCHKPLVSIVIVRPEYRRQGIATAMIEEAIRRASWTKVYTSTEPGNLAMHNLLHRIGFKLVGTIEGLNFDGDDEVFFCYDKQANKSQMATPRKPSDQIVR